MPSVRRACLRSRGERVLGGEAIFPLYDTHGIPIDLIAVLAEDEGVTLDREGFETMMAGARVASGGNELLSRADSVRRAPFSNA